MTVVVHAFPYPCMLPHPASQTHPYTATTRRAASRMSRRRSAPAGTFPPHTQPTTHTFWKLTSVSPLSSGGTYGIMGQMVLPMIDMAFEHINNMTTILPDVTLAVRKYDHQCNAGLAIKYVLSGEGGRRHRVRHRVRCSRYPSLTTPMCSLRAQLLPGIPTRRLRWAGAAGSLVYPNPQWWNVPPPPPPPPPHPPPPPPPPPPPLPPPHSKQA